MLAKKLRYFGCVLTLLGNLGVFTAEAQDTLTFTTLDEPRLVAVNQKILAEAYRRLGIQIKLSIVPAERALVTSNSGKVDGELMRIAGLSKRYPNLVMVPVPTVSTEMMAYTDGLSFPVEGWESLRPYRLGIPIGVKVSEFNTQGMNRYFASTYKQLLIMLKAKRIDVVLLDRLGGQYETRLLNFSEIKPLEPPVATIQLHHYLHKKHRHLVSPLTAVLQQLVDEGFPRKIKQQAIAQ